MRRLVAAEIKEKIFIISASYAVKEAIASFRYGKSLNPPDDNIPSGDFEAELEDVTLSKKNGEEIEATVYLKFEFEDEDEITINDIFDLGLDRGIKEKDINLNDRNNISEIKDEFEYWFKKNSKYKLRKLNWNV